MNHIETIDRCFRCTQACAIAFFSSALLLAAPSARADSITYQLLSNPQTDMTNSGNMADLLGTITISNSAGSPLGTFTSSNDSTLTVTSDLSMTSTGPDTVPTATQSGSASLSSVLQGGSVQFTSAGLFLFPSTTFEISNSGSEFAPSVEGLWNPANSGEYQGGGDVDNFDGRTSSFLTFSAGSYFVDGEWEIAAAVPEPGALALIGSAMVGLAVLGLRRRRALAA